MASGDIIRLDGGKRGLIMPEPVSLKMFDKKYRYVGRIKNGATIWQYRNKFQIRDGRMGILKEYINDDNYSIDPNGAIFQHESIT